MNDWAGKTVLVTGASSGIGRAVAQRLLASGAQVLGVARDAARLAPLDTGEGVVQRVTLDLLRLDDFPEAVRAMPALDGVVHSAGVVHVRPAAFLSLAQHQQVMDTNLTAPLALTGELLRQRKLAKGSSIVFVSSINGNQIGVKGCTSYAASKAGLVGASKVLAMELAPQAIRVNCVLPGAVDTPMNDALAHVSDETRAAELRAYPLGQRFAQPGEVASAILFLLSAEAAFITGQTLTVDGGCSVQ